MTDPVQNAAAPAAAPAVAPAAAPANPTVQRTPAFVPAQGAAPTPKHQARSPLITNPAPVVDADAPVAEEPLPDTLPASTIAEMEAGKEALKRHATVRPGAAKAEAAKTDVTKDAASKE